MEWHPKKLSETVLLGLPQKLFIYDGICRLCAGWIEFILKHERSADIYFVSAQSRLGAQLLEAAGIHPEEYESALYIRNGQAFYKLDILVEMLPDFGGIWKSAKLIKILPRGFSNWLYDRIAQNRYRLFGKRESCHLPQKHVKNRFLSE